MDLLEYQQSISPISSFFIKLLLFIIAFELIRLVFKHLKSRNKLIEIIRQYLPIAEIGFIIAYSLSYLPKAFTVNSMFAAIMGFSLIFIIGIIIWFSIRDVILGYILRSNKSLKLGNKLTIDNHSGSIKKLGLRNLILNIDNNNSIHIPYSKVIGSKIINNEASEKGGNQYSFEIEIEKTKPFRQIVDELEKEILSSPWSSINENPKIDLKEEKEKTYLFKVEVYLIDKKFNKDLEKQLKRG
jgi:branched-subunit amino acid transport protein AzlD